MRFILLPVVPHLPQMPYPALRTDFQEVRGGLGRVRASHTLSLMAMLSCNSLLLAHVFSGPPQSSRPASLGSHLLEDTVQCFWSANVEADEHSIRIRIGQRPDIIVVRGT